VDDIDATVKLMDELKAAKRNTCKIVNACTVRYPIHVNDYVV